MIVFLKFLRQFLFLALFFLFQTCAIFRPITEPTERILRRGSCIGFDVPPITLTSQQTAAERQLLGEEVQIEANGWLVSSSQSTSSNFDSSPKEKEGKEAIGDRSLSRSLLRRYYVERAVLKYYEKGLRYYRSEQILGEGFDGRVRLVPFSLSRKGREEERELARRLASEVNSSRIWLHKYHLKQEKRKGASAKQKHEYKEYLGSYFEEAKGQSGEWLYTIEKKWFRIP